jgi:hypothetical protein
LVELTVKEIHSSAVLRLRTALSELQGVGIASSGNLQKARRHSSVR